MDDARRRKAPDVDDVLVAPTVVSGQLYTVAAEERGIAEALFVLGQALDRGRVGADVFVKVCFDSDDVVGAREEANVCTANEESCSRTVPQKGACEEDCEGDGSGRVWDAVNGLHLAKPVFECASAAKMASLLARLLRHRIVREYIYIY